MGCKEYIIQRKAAELLLRGHPFGKSLQAYGQKLMQSFLYFPSISHPFQRPLLQPIRVHKMSDHFKGVLLQNTRHLRKKTMKIIKIAKLEMWSNFSYLRRTMARKHTQRFVHCEKALFPPSFCAFIWYLSSTLYSKSWYEQTLVRTTSAFNKDLQRVTRNILPECNRITGINKQGTSLAYYIIETTFFF